MRKRRQAVCNSRCTKITRGYIPPGITPSRGRLGSGVRVSGSFQIFSGGSDFQGGDLSRELFHGFIIATQAER